MTIIRNSGVSAVEGVDYIEICGNNIIQTFRIVRYIVHVGVRH